MFSNPEKNVERFGLRLGAYVADFGAGSGHYTFAMAKAVGAEGKVFAIDIQKEILIRIKREASEKNTRNIEIVWGDIETPGGSKLRDNFLDAVLISNTLHQVEDKETPIKEALRVLKPGSSLIIIDWSGSFNGLGPKEEDVFKKDKAKDVLNKLGASLEKEFDAGENHWGVIFKKR